MTTEFSENILMKKLKTLYTLNYARVAGTEKHVLYLLKHLNRDIFEPHVVCFSEGPLIDLLKSKNIKSYAIVRKHFLDVSAALKLFQYLKKNKFDIVHSHCGQFACVLAKLAGIKTVIETRHGLYLYFDQVDRISLFKHYITRLKATLVDLTLTVSMEDETLLTGIFKIKKNKVKYIRNGIAINEIIKNNTKLEQITDELEIQKGCKIVGTVSRFSDEKGIIYFIKSIKKIKKLYTNSHFVIVGDGPLKEELYKEVQKENIGNFITFTGYRHDALAIMSIFNVFVLPSLCEGMPYTLLEAMALKIPIVASNIFGNKELVINNDSGFLIEPKDIDAIAKSVFTLIKNPQKAKKMGEAGFKRVEQNFTAEKMTKEIEQTYLELIND